MSGIRACTLADLADGVALRVVLDGRPVALVRLRDQVYAIDDTCSHAEVSLAEGEVDVDECALECWKHGSLFDLRTGEALTLPAVRPVDVHEATVVVDEVFVTLADNGEAGR
ncbi:MAG: non-heme iron oxygenase ferredoxin subunit [Actinomycetota bacterium]|nr:non-heme iron oxygenase ferredoxin subunit [Actinomycetota bacterium]MEE3354170.1 non-heme iron oxygenase ferredoxin subunit [Actinomycetota bacterium]